MRRSSRIAATRVVKPLVKCDKYFKEYNPTSMECAEFIFLAEYFKMVQYLNPASLTFTSLTYICKKIHWTFYRILHLYENEGVYQMTREMTFYKLYVKPYTTKNIFNTVKMLVNTLPHDEYVDKIYCEKFTFETIEQYYNRMKMKSNIDDHDNYSSSKDVDNEFVGLMLKFNNVREMLATVYIGDIRSTVWVPVVCNVVSTIREVKEINPLEDVSVNLYAVMTKEIMAQSLKGLMSQQFQGREVLGQYINPKGVVYPREFSIMTAQLRKLNHDCKHLTRWCHHYRISKDEVAPMIAEKYIGEECSICWDKMTEVKLLGCGHAYCPECYKKIEHCAICRVVIRKK